jgi:hypothetical protein
MTFVHVLMPSLTCDDNLQGYTESQTALLVKSHKIYGVYYGGRDYEVLPPTRIDSDCSGKHYSPTGIEA